ncbi:MAG: hypothetical protein IJT76_04625 [Clostridia bacterium]|nr:hypothetical protein [Clostridia bacterium]
MKIYESWIRAHLPQELADRPIDVFLGKYLDGLAVMQEGERGVPDAVVFQAKDEEKLRLWQFETVCRFIEENDPPPQKIWRYSRDHVENGKWFYIERRHYDYNAIEDARLFGFECFLRRMKAGFPPALWEERVREHVRLMNWWYTVPHWDYDRKNLRFIEISGSLEHDEGDGTEEPRPGSVIRIID